MFLQSIQLNEKSSVAEIVAGDYRTAEVFRKHGIGYCCGGKWPVDIACEMQGVDPKMLRAELEMATRTNQVSNQVDFSECDTDFIIDYIINVHHKYLKKSLPITQEMLVEFAREHVKKYHYLNELESKFDTLVHELKASVQLEEEVIFPYIRHLSHAYKHKEPYGTLLIKTLRKPLDGAMSDNHKAITDIILSMRKLTTSYAPPEKACTSHKVVLAKLKELDNDLMQHFYLEQSILFLRVITIENELLFG